MHHKKISYWRVVAALAILSLAGLPSPAASFDSRHASDLAANPFDLRFRLDTAGGQRAFHIGERIPLTLAFSSDTPAKYKLNAASYDRSGRLPTEEFVMEKESHRSIPRLLRRWCARRACGRDPWVSGLTARAGQDRGGAKPVVPLRRSGALPVLFEIASPGA